MSTPSALEPLTPARLLATAAVLSFRPTTRDRSGSTLGVLVDASAQKHLEIAADGAWTMSAALPPKGLKPVLLGDWKRLDALERANGAKSGKVREKYTSVEDMLAALKNAA